MCVFVRIASTVRKAGDTCGWHGVCVATKRVCCAYGKTAFLSPLSLFYFAHPSCGWYLAWYGTRAANAPVKRGKNALPSFGLSRANLSSLGTRFFGRAFHALPPPNTAHTTTITRSSYYNADTADLEIGQEFEDAEAEEEAALELQRASYKRLDPADYGEEEDEKEDGEGEGAENEKGNGKKGEKRRASGQGAALLAMKSDLEQIALGVGGGEVGELLGVCGSLFACAGLVVPCGFCAVQRSADACTACLV